MAFFILMRFLFNNLSCFFLSSLPGADSSTSKSAVYHPTVQNTVLAGPFVLIIRKSTSLIFNNELYQKREISWFYTCVAEFSLNTSQQPSNKEPSNQLSKDFPRVVWKQINVLYFSKKLLKIEYKIDVQSLEASPYFSREVKICLWSRK